MHIDRAQANRYLAFTAFTICFLFLLVLIAFAFSG
jgi:hypothetical protein